MKLSIDTNFIREIKELVNSAKQRVVTSINIAMVYTYYEIGRRIVEQEQKGKHRANYGNELIKQLSAELTREFGKGYSEVNLRYFRKFYIIYSVNQIQQTVFAKSKITNFKCFSNLKLIIILINIQLLVMDINYRFILRDDYEIFRNRKNRVKRKNKRSVN